MHVTINAVPEAYSAIAAAQRRRATSSRRAYHIVVIVLVAVSLLLVVFFTSTTVTTVTDSNAPPAKEKSILSAVFDGISRVAAAAIAIFIIQMLSSFARYHARLANHLEAVADSLELAGGDAALFQVYVNAVTATGIDFGKLNSPMDKIVEVIGTSVTGLKK